MYVLSFSAKFKQKTTVFLLISRNNKRDNNNNFTWNFLYFTSTLYN